MGARGINKSAEEIPAPEPLGPELAADILASIARLTFQFAKTMADNPHEYTVKSEANEADYALLFHAVRDHGRKERWGKYRYLYLYPGDGWRYWIMANELRYSRILNRARVDGDHQIVLDRARAAGRLKE